MSLPAAAAGAAAVFLASAILGRRHKLAAAALLLAGGAWVARYASHRSSSMRRAYGETGHDILPELAGSPVDVSSSHSFPASDPPACR
ncbi:MAG TPA: hypothetical protein VHC22_31400 [Pirellulales bacterium]|nr:hypothetical protein [Pirellulales bacterium]